MTRTASSPLHLLLFPTSSFIAAAAPFIKDRVVTAFIGECQHGSVRQRINTIKSHNSSATTTENNEGTGDRNLSRRDLISTAAAEE